MRLGKLTVSTDYLPRNAAKLLNCCWSGLISHWVWDTMTSLWNMSWDTRTIFPPFSDYSVTILLTCDFFETTFDMSLADKRASSNISVVTALKLRVDCQCFYFKHKYYTSRASCKTIVTTSWTVLHETIDMQRISVKPINVSTNRSWTIRK